jgi:D-cysteine desulfhydrase
MNYLNKEKLSLGFFPTPLVELKRLSAELGGPQLFIKRDDNTGLGMGGNKTRKLEYILADALEQGADTVITAGAIQSNHCRQTAAAAASLGLECHLVLGGLEPDRANGNLLLDQLFGSHIHWAGDNRKGEDLPHIVSSLSEQGKNVYQVPYGGSNALGALGFVNAFKELDVQATTLQQKLTHIVFASSSGGTHAGLILGNKICGSNLNIWGINIDKGGINGAPLEQAILSLANETSVLLGMEPNITDADVVLNSGYIGAGYGVVGRSENEAIALSAKTEGVLLDPVYTARAMGGLIDMIRSGKFDKNDQVLFWHTGGVPALFAYSKELNRGLL